MEEETEGLDHLIQLRNLRPSYTRAISEELCHAAEQDPLTSKLQHCKNKSKHKEQAQKPPSTPTSADENDGSDESSCESEYHSAAEECDSSGTDESPTEEQNEREKHAAATQAGSKVKMKQGGSRRKAKWRRKKIRDEMFTFFREIAEDVFEANEVEKCLDDEETIVVLDRPVPKLAHLSAKAVPLGVSYEKLPAGMKPLLALREYINILMRFYSRAAHQVEHSDETFSRKVRGQEIIGHCRSLRNIFSRAEIRNDYEFAHELASYTLPATYSVEQWTNNHYSLHFTSAFECIVRLLHLCLQTVTMKNEEYLSEEQLCKCYTYRVKAFFQKRYLKVTNHMFDEALPYAWWAKGNLVQAERAFLHLVETKKDPRYQALYLNELGRLYSQFCSPRNAVNCFASAADKILLDNGLYDEEYKDGFSLVQVQSFMLSASAYDIGEMDGSKASSAAWYWQQALDCDIDLPASYTSPIKNAAVTSLVFVHAGRSPDVSDASWISPVRQRLVKMARNWSSCCLHLALLNAIVGDHHKTWTNLRNWLNIFEHSLVRNMDASVDDHPFMCINEQAAKCTINILPLLWRTRINHPVFPRDTRDKHFNAVADRSPPCGKLWMSDAGITGDMQMILPPIDQVTLDPYTGHCAYPQLPRDDVSWRTFNMFAPDVIRKDGSFRICLYESPTSSLHVIHANVATSVGSTSHDYQTQVFDLFWMGDGLHAKINLKKAIKNRLRDMLREYANHQAASVNSRLHELIDIFYQRDEQLTLSHIEDRIQSEKQAKHVFQLPVNERKRYLQLDRFKLIKDGKIVDKHKFMISIEDVCICKQTVILSLSLSQAHAIDMFVVVNCESEASFHDFRLISLRDLSDFDYGNIERHQQIQSLVAPRSDWQETQPDADVFILRRHSCPKYGLTNVLCVYDLHGNLLRNDVYTRKKRKERQVPTPFGVIGKWHYALHDTEDRVICDELDKSRISRIFGQITLCQTLGQWLFVFTEYAVFVCHSWMEPLLWQIPEYSTLAVDDGYCLTDLSRHKQFLTSRWIRDEYGEVLQVMLALDDHVILIRLSGSSLVCECYVDVIIPGYARDGCIINKEAGFLVTSSIIDPEHSPYFEDLFHFSVDGQLLAVLPRLGKGPHAFLPLHLPGDKKHKPGYYVYFKDGHGAVCCIQVLEE